MTVPVQENQEQVPKTNDKEYNFRMLEQKYQKQLEQERAARLEAERIASEAKQKRVVDDDDDDNEPYVDKKKLKRELNNFGELTKKQTQNEIQFEVHKALSQERQNTWLKNNGDFYDVMMHAEKLALRDPELAETILSMPEGFERQKLVYKNIKQLGLHEAEKKAPTIQDKIDANRRGPYYQPSGVGTSPQPMSGDFSKSGQKAAFDKMQDLKNRMRLG